MVKPFLKWAGGKTKLIPEINSLIERKFSDEFSYIEPFVGGGSVLFHILNNFSNIDNVVINDINTDLINVYKDIKENVTGLIKKLSELENDYYSQETRKDFYLSKRDEFNKTRDPSLFIFLNKTCFNGLYRVNKKGRFNTAFGLDRPQIICDHENLLSVSNHLQKVQLLHGSYEATLDYAKRPTLFYFDPPYKPISVTSNFVSYSKEGFSDEDQVRLRDFCNQITTNGHYFILSNSDLSYFDELYQNYNIKRVETQRGLGRNKKVSEILISNF